MNWTLEQLRAAWSKATIAEDEDKKHCYDCVGAKIYWDSRDNTDMAWEVDHIFPKEILDFFKVPTEKINSLENLRAMHHSNNESKGISFPNYTYTTKWNEDEQTNVDVKGSAKVHKSIQDTLRNIYEPILGMTLEEAIKQYLAKNKK